MAAAQGGRQPGAQPADEAIVQIIQGGIGIGFCVAGTAAGAVTVYGAQKMRRLESYGWAMTSAVLTVIPCTACCLWGWPIGIWSLVVLNRADVRDAFR